MSNASKTKKANQSFELPAAPIVVPRPKLNITKILKESREILDSYAAKSGVRIVKG